ncbi:sugar ABC transporter substrate-binding protein [Gemmobacter sp. 24YEA27]|uniref:sugar ABC transporter substrate-binding protein n=1 Tax=Gemmobacter sp. 24YEA27 TaxID=3040672 RepID=UPI0024B365F4|nr:sugar ABC transporter substrate-binding protein [Gemmobacter sp. 24YEA27]
MKSVNTRLAILLASAIAIPAGIASAQDADKPEIYKLMPDTALSGLVDPYMPDRTDIDKAWPKTPADPGKIQVGWTEITMGGPFFVELIKGAQKTADASNIVLDVQVADGDLQRQCGHIDTFITQGKDLIVIDPTDTLGVASCINRAVDAGIPVLAIGTVPSDRARILTTITPNPYENGFRTGEYVGQNAGTDLIVAALIVGVVGNSTSESRLNGMVSGMVWQRIQDLGLDISREDAMLRGYNLFQQAKKSGGFNDEELKFQVVAMGEGNWTEEGGLAAAEDILTAHGSKLTHILADNDWMGIGSLRALRNTGIETIKVATSADGARIALEEIKKGNLLVTGTFSGEQTGVSAVAFIDQIFNKGFDAQNLPLGTYFPAYAITPENVDDFIDPNPENQFYKYEVSPVLNIGEIRAAAGVN